MVFSLMIKDFAMQGARNVFFEFDTAKHLEEQIDVLERSVNETSPLAFDLSKTLIETICKTVMRERGQIIGPNMDLPKLLKDTLTHLSLLPQGHDSTKVNRDSLSKVAQGLQNAVQGLCELRNNEGFASHGRDAESMHLGYTQIILAASAADAVVHFVYMAHKEHPQSANTALPQPQYIDEKRFNEHCDSLHGEVEIFGEPYKSSELLFYADQDAYQFNLDEYMRWSEVEND